MSTRIEKPQEKDSRSIPITLRLSRQETAAVAFVARVRGHGNASALLRDERLVDIVKEYERHVAQAQAAS